MSEPLGINFLGFQVQQNWAAITMLNKILSDEPDIRRIVELGTGTGGLTLLFALHMFVKKGYVLTLDIRETTAQEALERMGVDVEKADVFKQDTVDLVRRFLSWAPKTRGKALVFCDDGHKVTEFNLYAPLANPGDLVMAHDWGVEIRQKDIKPEVLALLELYRQDEFDEAGTRILSMRRKRP